MKHVTVGEKKHPSWTIELWTINKWLRYTGFRMFISYDSSGEDKPTRIGLMWWGCKKG